MKPSDFVKKWGVRDQLENLLSFPPESLIDVKLSNEARNFLLEAGLPNYASPFLSFEIPKQGSLPTVSEVWQLPDNYNHLRYIGSNGSGDPICLDDSACGEVVYLNHDNYFEQILMNSSVLHLTESLLVFRQYVEDGATAESETWCLEELKRIDKAAWQRSSFWRDEVAMMKD